MRTFLRSMLCLLLSFLPVSALAQVGVSPILQGRQIFDARDFGAVPDDGADDTVAIQAAFNACHAAGGGTVLFSVPGTYIWTDYLTSAGASPTAPNTTLNAAAVVYSNTAIVSAPGVTHQLGIAKDDSRCYILRNADPTNGNSNITIDGGFWNGGGIVAEAAAPTATTFTIPGDYSSRLGAGVVFYVSNFVGKDSFTSTGASYSAPNTTITVAAVDSDNISAVDVTANYFAVAGDQTATYKQGQTATVAGNADGSTNASYLVNYVAFTGGATRIYVNDVPAGATASGTITVGAKAGGFQTSWQQSNAQAPAIASVNTGTETITITGDYRAFGSPGSSIFIYGNSDSASNRAYTIGSISYLNPTTTIVMDALTPLDAGIGAVTKGNCAFLYNERWFADLIRLENVDNFTIKNTKAGGVDKYVWHLVKCTHGEVFANTIDNGSDGFHLAGGCHSIVLRDQRGRTLDNYYATVADEKWYRPGDSTLAGDITDILFDGLVLDHDKTCFEPFRATGTASYTVENITLRSFKGVVGSGYGFRLVDDTAAGYGLLTGCVMKKFLAEDIDLAVPPGYFVGQFAGSAVKDATLRNIRVSRALNGVAIVTTPSSGTTTSMDSLCIDGVTTSDVPASTVAPVNAAGAVITNLVQINANVAKLALSNFQVKLDGYNTSPFSMSGVVLQVTDDVAGVEGWVQAGSLSNSQIESVCGVGMTTRVLSLLNDVNSRALSSYVDMSNVSCVKSGTTTAGATFTIVYALGNHNVDLNGVRVINTASPGTAPYIQQNTSGRTLRIGGSGSSWDTDNDGNFNDDSTLFATQGAIQIRNPQLNVALDSTTAAFLTGVTGDEFFNVSVFSTTSAREALGIGLYRYAAGGFWQYMGPPVVRAFTANTTLAGKHSGILANNRGASGTVTITLPPALVGMKFTFTRVAAQLFRFDPSGTETIALPSTGVQGAAGKYLECQTTGGFVNLVCNTAGTWDVESYSGTFAAEP